MPSNNNLQSILSYLKTEEIEIDFDEFQFQVESHPEYPSLLAFSDALFFFNVNNVATKIPFQQIDTLPDNYVAVLEDNLAFIQSTPKGFVKDEKPISKEELEKQWKEIILLVEGTENIEKNVNKKTGFLNYSLLGITLFLTIALLVSTNTSWLTYWLICFSAIGLWLAIETIKQSLGIKSALSLRFCGGLPNSNCDSVINSSKWNLFKIVSLSDISIIFFAAEILSLFVMPLLHANDFLLVLMKYGLWFTFPISFLSIYYQWKVEKKWCPLCLSIIAILYVQLASTNFFYHYNSFPIVLSSVLSLGIILFSTTSVWVFLKPGFLKIKELKESELKNNRFKRNYNLFRLALKSQRQLVDFENRDAIILGNPEASLKFYVVTSPFCGYCKEAHEVFHNILAKYSDQLCVCLRFNNNPSYSAEETDIVYRNLVRIYQEEGQQGFLKAMYDWFYYKDKDRDIWKKRYANKVDIIKIDKILQAQWDWVLKNDLNFTPCIIIGKYQYPIIYERKELEFFIIDLLEDNLNEEA